MPCNNTTGKRSVEMRNVKEIKKSPTKNQKPRHSQITARQFSGQNQHAPTVG